MSRPATIHSLSHVPALLGAIFLGFLTPSTLLAQAGSFPAMTFERGSSWQYLAELSEGVRIGSAVTAPQRPRGILKLSSDQRYVVWVELERGRLNLLEQQPDGSLEVRKVMPVSIGKNGIGKEVEGDKLTPVGVYRLTSFLADSTLDDFYGNGAYPMNYPNAHDRLLKRTGHGIWLHGLPKSMDERPLMDSDGCVVVDNDSLLALADFIDTGTTPIVLSRGDIQWTDIKRIEQHESQLSTAFEAWRQDWADIDNEGYLSHYAEHFSDLRRNKAEWSAYKVMVNNAKSFIQVKTSNISFIADPRDHNLVSVRFYQDYRSSNHDWTGWKEQLWQNTAQGWKIIYEGDG